MSSLATVYESAWFGQPAYVLETSTIRVVTTPGIGAKIVSIVDKQADYEWLVAPANRAFQPLAYGTSFVAQDMSGWDEMLPTIDTCPYPVPGLFAGTALPDHGEIWALPWDTVALQPDAVALAVTGRGLPYQLTRTMRAITASVVRLEYEVRSTGSETLALLWAAHPQFTADAGTRIVLPPEVQTVYNVLQTDSWGAPGSCYAWPQALTRRGEPFALDHLSDPHRPGYRKFYVLPDQPVSCAALVQSSGMHWLRLSWDSGQIPYLGIWIDECSFNSVSTIALEPSTGFYDSLLRAWENQRVMRLSPDSCLCWYVDIELGTGALSVSSAPV